MAEYKKYMFDNFVISGDKAVKAKPLEEMSAADFSEEVVTPAEFYAVSQDPERVEAYSLPSEPEVKYSQEEYDAAVRAAEEKGYERGFNNAVSEHEKIEHEALDNINNRLMTILADAGTQNAEQEQNALKFALSLVQKILPQLEQQSAEQEVESFIRDNFKNFAKESSLSFRFHPDMAATIAPKISQLAEKNDFEGKIAVHKDAALSLSDCRIEWQNGGVERNCAGVMSAVEDMLNN